MTVSDALHDIQNFLQDTVKRQEIKLCKEESEELVTPYVETCYLPHRNFTPTSFQTPGVLVCMDENEDGANESTVLIRLICSTYGGGFYEESQIPDAKGYRDLLALMEQLKMALWAKAAIGRCSLRKPIKMGMYDTELVWPYWYGYLEFVVDIPNTLFSMERMNYLDQL